MNRYNPEYFTKAKHKPMTIEFLTKAIERKAVLEAKVESCDIDNTLTLKLGKDILGKVSFSDLEYSVNGKDVKPASATSKVGRYIKFIPTKIEKDEASEKYIVTCSRKDIQQECYNNYISKLVPGDIIDATILKLVSYGAFCDIGCGIVALLPTNNISVTHIVDPEYFLKGIHSIKAVVSSNTENGVVLSHKELLGTWKEETDKLSSGMVVTGTVLSVTDYGVFVRLSQNLSGLAETPDMVLNVKDKVSVRVTGIKPDSMKVKLLIISKLDDNTDEGMTTSFDYSITQGHIDEWVYSTPTAKRQIGTVFGDTEE